MRLWLVDPYPLCARLDKQTYAKYLRKKVLRYPVIFVGILAMTTEIVLKRLIWNPKMLGNSRPQIEHWNANVQIVIHPIREFALAHGVINLVILPKIVWHILPIAV